MLSDGLLVFLAFAFLEKELTDVEFVALVVADLAAQVSARRRASPTELGLLPVLAILFRSERNEDLATDVRLVPRGLAGGP